MQKITIVDYGAGNIGSVIKKVKRIGYQASVAINADDILSSSKLILPGVGNFTSSVAKLKRTGMWEALNETVIIKKVPILGICLGMQLMAKHSEEGDTLGFGWIDAKVIRFNVSDKIKYKVPHIGWNSLDIVKSSLLFQGIDTSHRFYFVHGYHLHKVESESIIATTDYNYSFVSAVEKENVFGVQFHPEKSHDWGEKLIENFIRL